MEEKMIKKPAQSQRRGLLRKAFWAVAGVVGAGSLLTAKAAPAHASGSEGPTTFTATGGATAVSAQSDTGVGVSGSSGAFVGVKAHSNTNVALEAVSNTGLGVEAISTSNTGVYAQSDSGPGLHAVSKSDIGAILENPSGVAVQVKGHIQVQGDSIGQVILPSGAPAYSVISSAVTPNSVVLLSPVGRCDGVLSVTAITTGSFTINPNFIPTRDITIAYLIVN